MSLDAMRWAKKVKTGRSSAKSVLTWLADMCGADHCAFPSIAALAEATELDKKTVQSSLQHLVALGMIADTGERRGRTKQVIVYKLIGVDESIADVEHTQKREHYRKRDRLKQAPAEVNTTENGNITKNGTVSTEVTHPILDGNTPKNGIRNLSGIVKDLKPIPPIAPQPTDPEVELVTTARGVLQFLNRLTNGKTTPSRETLADIQARLLDEYTEAELLLVIEWRVAELLNNPKWARLLTASEIFRADKFSGFLLGANAWVAADRPLLDTSVTENIDFDESFRRLLGSRSRPKNAAEKAAQAEADKNHLGSMPNITAAKIQWRPILAKAYAKYGAGAI
ncbi:helix-turn-helix domain-containing protein [Yersinia mollaretii]|uniref:helix-turn-helix domain-containing protein n=1 Tax=Yersinia mollaretii TaxID=33060 RepID=UPI001643C70E|nr:helix-turn-helix domain-containing protein [Yersinia mollaretii]